MHLTTVWFTLYSAVASVNSSRIKRWLFSFALKQKTKEVNIGLLRNDTLVDKLVFGHLRREFGGCVRLMVVGSAPLAGNVLTFIRAVCGCVVIEG